MIEITEKSKCCGCFSCYNICPKKAIKMVEDEKGFKYPAIDKEKCIKCGLCQKKCPMLNSNEEIKNNIISYACYNKNINDRLNSSSGGVFILLAKEIIKQKGAVFGAVFSKQLSVNHICCETENELEKLMGSKYVQSNINDCYIKAKEYLKNGRYVLFTGTPCQIAGLYKFLGKNYDKLYTQDFICHGVPSPKVWHEYLKNLKNKKKEEINKINFRNKDLGWSSFQIKILFRTKSYNNIHTIDPYMRLFLSNICLRDSCYSCKFRRKYRDSDITLADYWGINNVHPEMNDNNGVSLIVLNSNKGKKLFEIVKDNLIFVKTDLDKAIAYNSAMTNSPKPSKTEHLFYDDLNKHNISYLANKYSFKPTLIMRIKNSIKRIIKK